MPWDASPGGGFTTGTPWFAFAPGREAANVATQRDDPESLLTRYRRLIRLRQGSPALRRGRLTLLTEAAAGGTVLAFLRQADAERVLVAHNLGGEPAAAGPFATAGEPQPLMVDPGAAAGVEAGVVAVRLPAHGSGVWRLAAGG